MVFEPQGEVDDHAVTSSSSGNSILCQWDYFAGLKKSPIGSTVRLL